MTDFDEQVRDAVQQVLLERGFYARNDILEWHRLVLVEVGSVVVLPPYVAVHDIRGNQRGYVELADPRCFDQLVDIIKAIMAERPS